MSVKVVGLSVLISTAGMIFVSCGKDKSYSLSGEVLNDLGSPLSGVTVDMDGESASTDSDGKFTLSLDTRPEGRKVMDLTKDGYFDQVFAKTISDSEKDYIQVVMVPREYAGSVDAESGGSFEHNGASFVFPANAFIGPDGSAPNGTIDVFVGSFTPDANNFGNSMPGGDFQANSDTEGEGVLTSFGALAVEAEDEDGQELTIREAADVCMPIPSSMLDKAPDTMEVWSMGAGGTWNSAGSATRVGSDYCFFMSGGNRVNCDIFSRMATLQGKTCMRDTEIPTGDIKVTVNSQMSTQSNGSGFYEILVPSGVDLSVTADSGAVASVEALEPDEVRTVDLGCDKLDSWCEMFIDQLESGYYDDTTGYATCLNTCIDELASCLASSDDCQGDLLSNGPCWNAWISCGTDNCYDYDYDSGRW